MGGGGRYWPDGSVCPAVGLVSVGAVADSVGGDAGSGGFKWLQGATRTNQVMRIYLDVEGGCAGDVTS